MPKEITIVKYCCNVCGYSYKEFGTAVMCENGPVIPEPEIFHVGDTITFESETHMESRSMTIFPEHGLVLAKTYLTIKNADGFFEHHPAYVVKYNQAHVVKCDQAEDRWEERVVFWADNGGAKRLFSPGDLHYKQNYHMNIPKNLVVLEHINSDL